MDFFQIVSSEAAGTARASVHEAQAIYVVFELLVMVGVCVLLAVVALIAPTAWELGSLSAVLHRMEVSKRQLPQRSNAHAPGDAPPSTKGATASVVAPTVSPPTAAAQTTPSPAPVTTVAPATPAAEPHKLVDLDAVLDEFCDEEELMDDAFVTAIATQGPTHAATKHKAAVALAPTEHGGGGSKTKAAPTTNKPAADDVDAELAKRMMRGFKPKQTTHHATTTPGHEKRVHDAPARHVDGTQHAPAATGTDAAADRRHAHEVERVDAAHSSKHPSAAHIATPPHPAAQVSKDTKAPHTTVPKATAACSKPPVDLDAVFDELQGADDVLNEALLDSVVSATL